MATTSTVPSSGTSVSSIPPDLLLRNIIDIKAINLAKLFNYYLGTPDAMPHAAPAWRALEKELQEKKTVSDDGVKYMLLDAFGCSVPPFVKFTVAIQQPVSETLPVYFSTIEIAPDVPPFPMAMIKESQTYW